VRAHDTTSKTPNKPCRRHWSSSLDAGSTPAISTNLRPGHWQRQDRASILPGVTDFVEQARIRWGEERARAIAPLQTPLADALAKIAAADLALEDEPDPVRAEE